MAASEAILFWLSLSTYVVAALLCAYGLVFKKTRLLPAAVVVAAAGLLPHTAAFIVRWIATGRPPFLNLYELILAGAWFIVVTFVVAQFVWRHVRPVGAAVMPVAFLSMGVALMLSPQANPLAAALQSWWLVVHILFALVSYGCFAISFGAAILLLITENKDRPAGSMIPPPEQLDGVGARCIYFGFICLTVRVISGSIWANNAWGRYWGWDPVDVWSLVTWLLYGLYAHLRPLRKWKRRHAAWFSVVAFVVVVFSFWGVPHLWQSIHDYSQYSGQ